MERKIQIRAGEVIATAVLNDTPTAQAVWQALPIEARASTWGDEIYFSIPVQQAEQNAQAVVALGDLGYWPPGHAFCIFFGQTPMSTDQEIRPASPVNVIGRIEGDPRVFRTVRSGARIALEAMTQMTQSG